jgi:hypothetical protein
MTGGCRHSRVVTEGLNETHHWGTNRGKMAPRLLLLKNWQELCQGCRVAHAALFLWPGATGEEARFLIANLELEIGVSYRK